MTSKHPERRNRGVGYYRVAYKYFKAIDDGEKSYQHYADLFNVDPGTIKRWRLDGRDDRYYASDPDKVTRAGELIKSGWTYAAAGREVGLDRSILQFRFPGYGGNYRNRGRKERDVWDIVADLVADRCSVSEIARTTGLSGKAIIKRFPEASWTRQEVIEFERSVLHARKKMPKYIHDILFEGYADVAIYK